MILDPPAPGVSRRRLAPLLLASALLATLAPRPARAAAPAAAALGPEDRADIARIEAYLNGIRTLSARFQQLSGEGGSAAGTLYLARPGRMRFEYDPPSPILIMADGTWVIYYDRSLQEVTYLSVGSTPAWFLLRDTITLSGDVMVTRFERGPGVRRVTVTEAKEPEKGVVTLTFSDRPLDFRQWTVLDAQGKTTTVVLSDVRTGLTLDPKIFDFVDPRTSSQRHNR